MDQQHHQQRKHQLAIYPPIYLIYAMYFSVLNLQRGDSLDGEHKFVNRKLKVRPVICSQNLLWKAIIFCNYEEKKISFASVPKSKLVPIKDQVKKIWSFNSIFCMYNTKLHFKYCNSGSNAKQMMDALLCWLN